MATTATPATTATDTAQYWNARSPDFSFVHARLSLIGRLIAELPNVRTMLDVGCGPAALRRAVPERVEYFGVDIAPAVIDAQRDPAHFEVANLDETAACFGGRRFDLVVCSGVFEYINNVDGFVRFLQSASAPNAHLILSFTNHQHVKDGLRWVSGKYTGYTDPHVNFLLVPEVRRLLERGGWTVLGRRAITKTGREHPLWRHFTRFPLNVLNRQYIFVCRRDAGRA